MNNKIEIVFGDSLYLTINECEFMKNHQIIKFDKFFSFVDLSDVDNNVIKLSDDFCGFIYSEIHHKFDNIDSLESTNKELDATIKKNSKVRIWTTHDDIDEYLTFIYVCNYLLNANCDLYVMFSDEYNKECYSPTCLFENELEELTKLEHKLSKEEILKYSNEWEKVVKDNSDMRVMENGKVKSVTFDYYNNLILNKLDELGEVKTVFLIANLMTDYHLTDIFFDYLINRLIKLDKIRIVKMENNLLQSIITTVNN